MTYLYGKTRNLITIERSDLNSISLFNLSSQSILRDSQTRNQM